LAFEGKHSATQEKILTGRLDELGALIDAGGVEGPALLVIGDVASKADGAALADLALLDRRAA
jgi:uroporphyrin-III C-methyltransferase/precorrin-2 dehydrogenase/sirohydrochlorin ferrochelatase